MLKKRANLFFGLEKAKPGNSGLINVHDKRQQQQQRGGPLPVDPSPHGLVKDVPHGGVEHVLLLHVQALRQNDASQHEDVSQNDDGVSQRDDYMRQDEDDVSLNSE